MDWKHLEHNKIDRQQFTKRHRNKNGLNILKNLKGGKKRSNFSPVLNPYALDHLAIGLVANKYTKFGKTSDNLLLSQGLYYIKIPLCYTTGQSVLDWNLNKSFNYFCSTDIFMILANVGGNWSNPRKCYLGSLRIEYIAGEIPLHLLRSHLGSKYFLSNITNMSHHSWHNIQSYIFQVL